MIRTLTAATLVTLMATVAWGATPVGEATSAHRGGVKAHDSPVASLSATTATPLPTPSSTFTPKPAPAVAPTRTPAHTASPTPNVTPSASATPSSSSIITVCGGQLCVGGRLWHLYGASHNSTSDSSWATSTATQAGFNTLRLTNFLNEGAANLKDAYDPSRWAGLDGMIAASTRSGLHVILDLSTYRNLLWNNCIGPNYDWISFLRWVSARVNTVDGRLYGQDPTIAVVALAGEYQPPGTYSFTANDGQPCTMDFTTTELTAFYNRTLRELRTGMPSHLAETGGFLHLDYNAGIDWQTIMADPDDQLCSLHVYSGQDATVAVPAVAAYCKSIGKPWIEEEFGFPQSQGDAVRAQEFTARYALATMYGAAGTSMWNLGPQLGVAGGTYDVNPGTPLTFAAVQANAP